MGRFLVGEFGLILVIDRLLDGLKVTAASPGRVKFEVEVLKEHTVSVFLAFGLVGFKDTDICSLESP